MSGKFLVSSFFLYFLYFLTYSDGAVVFRRIYRQSEDVGKFTVIYRASNENYSQIADMDSNASFIMSANFIEKSKIAKSVKNNEKKQAIILELNDIFINQPQTVQSLVRELVVNFRETVNMELKYVLIATIDRGSARVQQFINELESRDIAAICHYQMVNSVDRIPEVVFHNIILVDFACLNSAGRSTWSRKWETDRNSERKGLSMKKFMRQCSEVIIASPTQQELQDALPRQSPQPTVRTDPIRNPNVMTSSRCISSSRGSSSTGFMTGSSGSSSLIGSSGRSDTSALKSIRRSPRFITGGIKTCTNPNSFTLLFKGLANYHALKHGYHPGAAVLISSAETCDLAFPEISRELYEDRRNVVLLIEAEDVEILLSARSMRFKVREFLNLIPGEFFKKHFIFADDSFVSREIRQAFTDEGGIEIYDTNTWNPEEDIAPRGFVVVELETKPGKVLRELDAILDEKELTPSTFDNCIDPFIVIPGVNVSMSEVQKHARFHEKLNETFVRSFNTINLDIDRQFIFRNSYDRLNDVSDADLKAQRFVVHFDQEIGIDAGGLAKDWFETLTKVVFNPDYALFKPSETNRNAFTLFEGNSDELFYLTFIGRIIGKGLIEQMLLPCHFTNSLYKLILGQKPNLNDLAEIHPETYRSLCWIADNEVSGILDDTTFVMDVEEFGERRELALIEDGANIKLNDTNKFQYIRLITKYKLETMIREQADAFISGFNRIVPAALLSNFTVSEFKRLLSGLIAIDINDWRINTVISIYDPTDIQITWFWQAVESFVEEERRSLLKFVTGSPSVPLDGFRSLSVRGIIAPFRITKSYENTSALPIAHTCFNRIDIPQYENYEKLRGKLLQAAMEGAGGFEIA